MNLKIEIVGLPASGKTYFFNCLKKKIKEDKINYVNMRSYKDLLLEQYLKKKTKVSLINKVIYKLYIKKVNVKSNFLFKKEYKDLNAFITQNLKRYKNYLKVLSLYKNYINTANYNNERKSRMLKNFQIDFIGAKLIDFNFKFSVYDEGFFQKIFFNFECMTNLKFNLKEQMTYLKFVPRPDLVVFINTNITTCLKRAKSRVDGFLYNHKLIKNSKKKYFNKSVINFAKKNNIPIITLSGNKSIKDNIKVFFKKIEKLNN